MVDVSLWASIPFRNPTAWTDFLGEHALWHRALAETVFRLNGINYRTYPLGDGGGIEWMQAHQQEHIGANHALGLGSPADMEDDLSTAEAHASWCFIHSQEHRLLRSAAGIL